MPRIFAININHKILAEIVELGKIAISIQNL